MRGLRHNPLTAALAVALILTPVVAPAKQWVIAPAQSYVVFEYERGGELRHGRFTGFAGEGTLDPEALGEARLELRLATDSIDLGSGLANALANALATSTEWFDSANHPLAVYRLRALTPLEDGSYWATGEITIRGRTRPITAGLVLEIGDEAAHAVGSLRLDRTEFQVGFGLTALLVGISR